MCYCSQLSTLIPPHRLVHGAGFAEPTRSSLASEELRLLHSGKERSIHHMLTGGNGFPDNDSFSHYAQTVMDAGATNERRDLRSLQVWSRDLTQCQADRKRGRCDG